MELVLGGPIVADPVLSIGTPQYVHDIPQIGRRATNPRFSATSSVAPRSRTIALSTSAASRPKAAWQVSGQSRSLLQLVGNGKEGRFAGIRNSDSGIRVLDPARKHLSNSLAHGPADRCLNPIAKADPPSRT